MPATLVEKLAPAPKPAISRTRPFAPAVPAVDEFSNFKQALAQAQPRSERPQVPPSEHQASAVSEKPARSDQQTPDSKIARPFSSDSDTAIAANKQPEELAVNAVEAPADFLISNPNGTTEPVLVLPIIHDQPLDEAAADADLEDYPETPAEVSANLVDAVPQSVEIASDFATTDFQLSAVTPVEDLPVESQVKLPEETETANALPRQSGNASPAITVAAVQADAEGQSHPPVDQQPGIATAAPKPVVPQAPRPAGEAATPSFVAADANPDASAYTDAGTDTDSGNQPAARNPSDVTTSRPDGFTRDDAARTADFAQKLNDHLEQLHHDKGAETSQPVTRTASPAPADRQVPMPSPQQAFVQQNHERIVSSVRTQLLPNGGSMQIRLQPENLGAMQISVRMVDGVMSASFQTSNDEATRLLSHSLSQLKASLETQGIQVDRIHVTQAPRETTSQEGGSQDQHRDNPARQEQQQHAHEENQRRLILNRMWRRMATGEDPLDLVA